MNRLFTHQMHPQVSRDIITEMSLPTHTLNSTIWLMLQVVQREVKIFQPSLLSPKLLHSSSVTFHFIICYLNNYDIITVTSKGWLWAVFRSKIKMTTLLLCALLWKHAHCLAQILCAHTIQLQTWKV